MKARKKLPVIWDIEAVLYLQQSLEYIRKDSSKGADTIRDAILGTISMLSDRPELFQLDKLKLTNDGTYRAFTAYSYRISYRVASDSIQILRVTHTSQEPLEH